MSDYVRPSASALAEKCRASATLMPVGNENTTMGTAVHAEVAAAIAGSPEPTLPAAQGIVRWVREVFISKHFPEVRFYTELHMELPDPETGEILTEGTADLVTDTPSTREVTVLDWKSDGQLYGGLTPENSLQTDIYGVMAGLKFKAAAYRVILVFYSDDGRVTARPGGLRPASEWQAIIDRVKAIRSAPVQFTTGNHCDHCYGRLRCPAWLLPAMGQTPVALQPLTATGLSTKAEAEAVGEWLQRADSAIKLAGELRDRVAANFEAWCVRNGPVQVGTRVFQQYETPGRRSGASVAELEKAGLGHMIKVGRPSVKWGWRDAK